MPRIWCFFRDAGPCINIAECAYYDCYYDCYAQYCDSFAYYSHVPNSASKVKASMRGAVSEKTRLHEQQVALPFWTTTTTTTMMMMMMMMMNGGGDGNGDNSGDDSDGDDDDDDGDEMMIMIIMMLTMSKLQPLNIAVEQTNFKPLGWRASIAIRTSLHSRLRVIRERSISQQIQRHMLQ